MNTTPSNMHEHLNPIVFFDISLGGESWTFKLSMSCSQHLEDNTN